MDKLDKIYAALNMTYDLLLSDYSGPTQGILVENAVYPLFKLVCGAMVRSKI